jgi:hypothetical protein
VLAIGPTTTQVGDQAMALQALDAAAGGWLAELPVSLELRGGEDARRLLDQLQPVEQRGVGDGAAEVVQAHRA